MSVITSVTITNTAATSTTTNTPENDEQHSSEVQLDKDGETYRKLFVGGLSWQTTEDNLQRYFQTLNLTVERVLIMREKASGRSRGFGFVILKHQDMVDKALSLPLQLDGRKIEAKRAISKRDIEKSHKIFVGGIPMSLTQTDFKKFFESFGAVTDCQIMMERDSGRSRGFGFVTFELESSMEKVLATQHSIQGKPVEVKRAEPKKKEVAQVPIIVPVPTYFPSGYSYPVAYPNSYGQALAYDGSGGFIAVYPQYNLTDGQYEQYYSALTPGTGLNPVASPAASPAASPVVTPVISPVASPDGENTTGRHRASRRDNSTSPSHSPSLSPTSPSSSLSSLAERVRVLEVRKKRGLSNPEQVDPRARKHASSTGISSTISSVSTGRKSVVPVNSANWRSRGNATTTAPTTTTATTATTTTTATATTSTTPSSSQKGGALHKYFQ